MHVREFMKPAAVKLKGQIQRPGANGLEFVEEEVSYRYEDYVGQYLWAYGKWNTESEWQDAQIRIGDAIDQAEVGQMIRFEEMEDWEKFREANMAASITGPHAHRVRKHQKAGKNARSPVPQVVDKAAE